MVSLMGDKSLFRDDLNGTEGNYIARTETKYPNMLYCIGFMPWDRGLNVHRSETLCALV